ncbi:hypothetical protein Leryth_006529 [Lithospermum erythrorhizon]|nr:hypothetical protein Leryth_006529 [Lithospermum erythrorhizon]
MAPLSHSGILPSSSSSLPHFCTHHIPRTPKLYRITKPLNSPRSIHLLALSSSSSSHPIFLPFLQNQQPQNQELEDVEKENLDFLIQKDPIFMFLKSQISDSEPDPSQEGKLAFQKNRKISWHLAFDNSKEPPIEEKVGNFQLSKDDSSEENGGVEGQILQVVEPSNGKVSSGDSVESFNEYGEVEECENVELGIDKGGVVGEVLEKARALPENVTLGEVLEGLEGRVGEKECLEILESMGKEGLVRCCLYFFEWMGVSDPCLVTPQAYSIMFPLLGKAGLGKELMVLFKNLPSANKFRDVHVYNAAISGLLCCGRYDDAWKLYKVMEMNNTQPDHVTCSILITIMRKRGDSAKDAWEFFQKMNRKGVKWSLNVLGALIKAFCDEGLKKEALLVQLEMERRGISSNVVVYNTIMDAYVKSNQIEEAEGLFAEMRAKGVSPSTVSYNTLMDAYSRRMQPDVVEKLLVEMKSEGLEPNVKSYTCLISAYGRLRKMSDKAADAFLRMRKVGIKPNSHSYTALIHAYSVSGWHEKAYLAFQDMQREGIVASIETYTTLLDAFRRAGDTEMLMKIWKMMIRDKIEGTRVTFNILLDGFAKQGHYVEARDVICEFGKIGLQPTVMTYNMLMNAYGRGGQESRLPHLLKEMAALNLKPDSITYSTMIYAFVRVRDFRRAFFYHKQMVKSGNVPDAKSYEKLRAILDVKAAIKNRKDKSALMGIINSSMGLMKQRRKGKKDELWKHKKKGPRPHDSSQGQR